MHFMWIVQKSVVFTLKMALNYIENNIRDKIISANEGVYLSPF